MVDQLYTNARTDTYKHPSRYVRAAVGIGRGARSGWVELGWRMGRSEIQMGQVGTSDGSEQDNEWGRLGRRMGRSGTTNGAGWDVDGSERDNEWGRLGRRMGRSGTTNGAGWDVGWVGAEQRTPLRGREHLYSAR